MPATQTSDKTSERGHSPAEPAVNLNNILVPVDFSEVAKAGLNFAAGVAERFHSQIHLLHIVEPPSLPQWGYAHLKIRDTRLRKLAEGKMSLFIQECSVAPHFVHSTEVRCGEADLQICQAAKEWGTDLIILATHGRGGVAHALLGSTAEMVARCAPCPVLTVRERSRKPARREKPFGPKRILVTTDFSEASKKAFPYAAALARKFDASVTLLHVVPGRLPAELSHLGILLEERRLREEAREKLPQLGEALAELCPRVQTLIWNGGPAHEICKCAESCNADLIVIFTHGRSALKHFLLGSVTENVVRHAPCPVLVVREREQEFVTG